MTLKWLPKRFRKGEWSSFAQSIIFLACLTLALRSLISHISEKFELKPTEYTLGLGNISFSFENSSGTTLSHMYVGAAGFIDNPKDDDHTANPWSPWTDSGLKLSGGECLKIKATGTVHLSLRRIVSEKLRPYLLLLDESPSYVGPNGTKNLDITSQQRFLQKYSLYNIAPLGMLIAKIGKGDENNMPFKVGNSLNYKVPENIDEGTLRFAVNDISFRKQDDINYDKDHSKKAKKT